MLFDTSALDTQDIYRLLVGGITPRPIAWISTLSRDGVANGINIFKESSMVGWVFGVFVILHAPTRYVVSCFPLCFSLLRPGSPSKIFCFVYSLPPIWAWCEAKRIAP